LPTDILAITILLGGFALLLLLRVPVALAIAVPALGAAAYLNIPLFTVGQRMVAGLNTFSLLAIPFFILAGEIMVAGGIARRLVNLAGALVGWLRGGLAMINITASTFFGGISGSAVADTSSIGAVMIPMMKKKGYGADYSVGVTISSAAQGVMLPPSHNMIIYSLAAGGVSVGALFMAGILPGLLLGLALMITSYVLAVRRGYPKEEMVSLSALSRIVWEGLLGLLTPVIIIGGISSGIFTATESAAIACVYAFFLTFVVYREIPLREIISILKNTFRTLAIVLFLIAAASAFGYMLAFLQVPTMMTEYLLGLSDNRIVILLVINAMLLFLGAVMDMAPLILIMTPILLPVATSIGMDPVHFGVMLVFNLSIGLITPPVGGVLFVGCAIGKISMERALPGVLPFYVPMLVALLLITFFPALVLTVPGWFDL
jgi:tripartite ATP-independent transporter DctM subunit